MNNILSALSQLDPETLKQLLLQVQSQPKQEGIGPMGDPRMPTDVQQQYDPNMLAALLRGNKIQLPPGTPTIGVRG